MVGAVKNDNPPRRTDLAISRTELATPLTNIPADPGPLDTVARSDGAQETSLTRGPALPPREEGVRRIGSGSAFASSSTGNVAQAQRGNYLGAPPIGATPRRTSTTTADSAPTGAPGAMTRERAREIIDAANRMSVSSSASDDFVRNNVTAEVLRHATPQEKAHMLRCLMDGPTGADDEAAMARILQSVTTPEEMAAVLEGAGGADAVWDELDSGRAAVADHFRSLGENGARIILAIGQRLSASSSLSDDFVRDHVSANVLQHATPQQKAHMLRCLMDGPTGDGDERAMLRVLQSINTPAELNTVLTAAGGAGEVWSELEGRQSNYIAHLRSQGDQGSRMIATFAAAIPVSSSDSDDFVRNHVDAAVLAHATVDQKATMVRQLRDGNFSSEDRAAMERVLLSAGNPVELMTIAERGGGLQQILGMNDAHRRIVTDGYNAHSGDASYARSLSRLLVDPQFQSSSADTKTAVLRQAANYPNERSVGNLQRLVQKDWFQSMNLADQQRSAKMVAFVSQHPGDRTIIDNTLDRFLAPNATYRFGWEEAGAYGSASGSTFNFNRRYLPAGNDPVDTTNDNTMHMVTHTVAHEVNHLVNADRVSATADYFQAEYRAFVVGFRAQHGRHPTRAEALDRVQLYMNATPGSDSVGSVARALHDPVEGPKVIAFLQQFLGRNDVTVANAGSLPPRDPHLPAPIPRGDLDN